MPEASFCYYKNEKCAYFPCHDIPEGTDYFNCMFCYCPLFSLGPDCGGSFKYLEGGIKDCSGCMLPHSPNGYGYINMNFPRIVERMQALKEAEDNKNK